MKTGRSLQQIAAELERQVDQRRDYIAPQGKITATVVTPDVIDQAGPGLQAVSGEVVLDGINGDPIPFTNYAHGQLGDLLKIPRAYYDRMRTTHPDLLAKNINTWLRDEPDARRMIRTLDGRVRAVLSPKYRPLDNFDLAQSVLPRLQEMHAQVLSAELTETRFYIKAILPHLSDQLPEGMVWGNGHNSIAEYGKNERGKIVSAIVLSNSEVGAGTLWIEPSTFTTWCTNLAIMQAAAMKKYHVGRAFDADVNLEVFRDETRQADDRAFWLKVQDVVGAAFDPAVFKAAVDQICAAAGMPIVSKDLPKVIDVTVQRLQLPTSTSGSILTYLAQGGDLSKWGLASAITATANDQDDYQTATELERAGGTVLALPAKDWDVIAKAA